MREFAIAFGASLIASLFWLVVFFWVRDWYLRSLASKPPPSPVLPFWNMTDMSS